VNRKLSRDPNLFDQGLVRDCHLNPTTIQERQGNKAALRVTTLGGFHVFRDGLAIKSTDWGREKAIYLFQYFITNRRKHQHKEQIIDQLWPELDPEAGDRDFKVALNAVNKAIEPERQPRSKARFIQRFDLAYGVNLDEVWVDVDAFETNLKAGNESLQSDPDAAIRDYTAAVDLYKGEYLPERRYEDWTSAERERLSTLAMSAMATLAELKILNNPRDSLRLTQRVLLEEPLWEEAYRVQMRAFQALGNRPMALKTYQECVQVLNEEFGIEPLPETQSIYEQIRNG
jgi:two-component SAPR family response regulator